MRRHEVIVAALHLLAASFVAGCVAIVWIGAAMLAPTFEGSFIPPLLAAVGRPIAIFLLVVAAADAIAAIALLFESTTWARRVLLVISLPLLTVFPIGSALGIYSLWALRWSAGRSPDPTIATGRSVVAVPVDPGA